MYIYILYRDASTKIYQRLSLSSRTHSEPVDNSHALTYTTSHNDVFSLKNEKTGNVMKFYPDNVTRLPTCRQL